MNSLNEFKPLTFYNSRDESEAQATVEGMPLSGTERLVFDEMGYIDSNPPWPKIDGLSEEFQYSRKVFRVLRLT